jgi:hypothetical protein
MPTITVLSNAKIEMFADDHSPPHFHLRGRANRGDLAEAFAWARANADLLEAEWRRLNER